MSEKLLKYLIFIWGAISLVAFTSVRFERLFNGVLKEDVVDGYWDKTKYGELYYFSMIKHFREEGLPPSKRKFEHSKKAVSITDCDILVFGDSFFEFSRHKQFPERLSDDFSKKVHFMKSDLPLSYLAENAYTDTTPKLVIFERVERYIPVAFEHRQERIEPMEQSPEITEGIVKKIKNLVFYDNSEALYDVMLKRSYLTTWSYSRLATLKFDLYGSITDKTPVYLKDGSNSWLFYHDQVNESRTSFYYPFSDNEIDSICDHMQALSDELSATYNMKLLFLPLPAKYTMYHRVINNDTYNEFLPRLYKGLEKRGVNFVDVFELFRNSEDLLYYRTDSHWNQDGIDIAYKETLEYINKDSTLSQFLYHK